LKTNVNKIIKHRFDTNNESSKTTAEQNGKTTNKRSSSIYIMKLNKMVKNW